MSNRIQFRRDTKARWAEINPVLMEGEIGLEIDTNNIKMGDGTHAWNNLDYGIGYSNVTGDAGTSESLVMTQKAVTELVKGIKEGMSASEYIAIRVPDFSTGVTSSGSDRSKEIFSKFTAWLDAVDFANGNKYIGHCILGLDGRNVDVYNYIFSYANKYGIQIVEGGFTIGTDGKIQTANAYHILMRICNNGVYEDWKDYCEQSITSTEGTSTKLAASQKLLNDVKTTLQGNIDANKSSITSQGARISTLETKSKEVDETISSMKTTDSGLRTDVTELQESVFPMSVGLTLDKTLVEYTGTAQTIKASYNIKRKGVLVVPTTLSITTTGTVQSITPASSGTYTFTLNSETTVNVVLAATKDNLKASASASVRMVAPIYCGFGSSGTDIVNSTNKLSVRTSAVGTYTKKNESGSTRNFIILVPTSISLLTNFSMGGAPFVMTSSGVVVNGIKYNMYKSGSVFSDGTTVSVQAS